MPNSFIKIAILMFAAAFCTQSDASKTEEEPTNNNQGQHISQQNYQGAKTDIDEDNLNSSSTNKKSKNQVHPSDKHNSKNTKQNATYMQNQEEDYKSNTSTDTKQEQETKSSSQDWAEKSE